MPKKIQELSLFASKRRIQWANLMVASTVGRNVRNPMEAWDYAETTTIKKSVFALDVVNAAVTLRGDSLSDSEDRPSFIIVFKASLYDCL
ncbi:MAG: hypothetical protein U0905_11015 [Pirellulales bacterium]